MKSFKKILISLTAVVLCITILFPGTGYSQLVTQATKKRISIGVGLHTDIWMNTPSDMDVYVINRGVNLLATYNMPFGKSDFSFAIGLGVSIHNLFWNYRFEGSRDSMQFVKIEDTLSYKRSKLVLPYIELPVEFRFNKKNFAAGIGFKVGYMVNGRSKYVGDDYLYQTDNKLIVAFKNIRNIEKFAYGPTVRFGYKWIHVTGYYSLGSIFQKGKGPDIYPISVGIMVMPFNSDKKGH